MSDEKVDGFDVILQAIESGEITREDAIGFALDILEFFGEENEDGTER